MYNFNPAKSGSPEKYLVIHGHFYQPPRENPWIGEIDVQNSAHPFHDWNQKINFECYQPNSMARIYDGSGRIVDILNNFELISFNFGPTLFSWLEKHDSYTYEKIIKADIVSRNLFSGHGNAIAQAYNHMIMPLANDRDRITQIRWGIYDFKRRFGREPEAMWLPETAVNYPTLRDLIYEGMKFVILSPHQALTTKPIHGREWRDVADGSIDTTRPYRCFLANESNKYIDVFFYNDELAKKISFGDALKNAESLIEQLERVCPANNSHPTLINVATDGETFGHHKTFGDLTLAYTLNIKAKKAGFIITNYAEYLSKHPPQDEVRIKPGPKGAGTSWSCFHGVERWRSDCGCHTGGAPDWNQAWRKPLRKALDTIREKMNLIFEQHAPSYLGEIRGARDTYISIILDRTPQNIKQYLSDWQNHELTYAEKVLVIKLLEMERYSMLMYTSCGWFFSEVSGIETIQIIRYAACAIQLAQEFTHEDLEDLFLKLLAKVPSNIEKYRDAREIYKIFIEPHKVDFTKVANHYAISSLFEDYQDIEQIYCYQVHRLDYRRESFGDLTLVIGHIKIFDDVTMASLPTYFVLLRFGLYDFRCSVKAFGNHSNYLKIKNGLFSQLNKVHVLDLIDLLEEHFGKQYFSLKDLFQGGKRKIVHMLYKDVLQKLRLAYQEFYEENRRMVEVFNEVELPLPTEYLISAEYTLSHQLAKEIDNLERPLTLEKFERINDILCRVQELHLELKHDLPQKVLADFLIKIITKLSEKTELELLLELEHILQVAQNLKLNLNKRIAQDIYLQIIKKRGPSLTGKTNKGGQALMNQKMIAIGSPLGFNMQEILK
jgi:alpha-amylase/alpha-mannosidase (GH57 family)